MPGVRPILHMALFHPANDHYGMSPHRGGGRGHRHPQRGGALEQGAARQFGAALRRAGLQRRATGNLTAEQFERLKAELEQRLPGRRRNAGRPLLLEGGLDWKPMSLSPKDMDFIEAKHAAAREIALALGVPPMLLGIPGDNTYSNYSEANRVVLAADGAAAGEPHGEGALGAGSRRLTAQRARAAARPRRDRGAQPRARGAVGAHRAA